MVVKELGSACLGPRHMPRVGLVSPSRLADNGRGEVATGRPTSCPHCRPIGRHMSFTSSHDEVRSSSDRNRNPDDQ